MDLSFYLTAAAVIANSMAIYRLKRDIVEEADLGTFQTSTLARVIMRLEDLEKSLDEKSQYLKDAVSESNKMSIDRAKLHRKELDVVKDEISALNSHMIDLAQLEYRPQEAEDGASRLDMEHGRDV